MALHRLASITIGVSNVEETSQYYSEFGLRREGDRFSTRDGGEQLRIVKACSRRLIELTVGADDPDDLDRVTGQLARLGVTAVRAASSVRAVEPHSGARVVVAITSRLSQEPAAVAPSNGPGRTKRVNDRAAGIQRQGPVRPRKLGHVVI